MKLRILATQINRYSISYTFGKSYYKLQVYKLGIWWTYSTFDTLAQAKEAKQLLEQKD